MADEQGYDIPEEWFQVLNSIERELCLVPGWEEFKKFLDPLLSEMDTDPMTKEQSMVFVFYARLYEDPEWGFDQVRDEPTDEEEREDFDRFKKALRRLVNAAPELLRDYQDEEVEIIIDVGGNSVSIPVMPELETEAQGLESSLENIPGQVVMGYQLPLGKIKGVDSDHAVVGGWMTQNGWDKVKSGRKQDLTPEEGESFNRWKSDYQQSESQRNRIEKDEEDLRDWIETKLSLDANSINPGPTQTIYAKRDFGVQCFLLDMLPKLARRPSWMPIKDWVENDLGLDSFDDLYPVVTTEGRLFHLDHLIFNFGYGPNYFNWSKQKPYMLKGTPSTLYLVSMDVGKVADRESTTVWKIGITQKEVVGSSASSARFYGKVGEHVRVIREKRYKDGRDAFMIEQTIMDMSHQESFYDRQRLGISYEKSSAFEAFDSLDKSIALQLGYSEWIFPHKAEDEVIAIYDRMTAYGEFHGEGNVSYSPFKRDFNKT